MVHAIEMGWFIINKYYELTDIVPAYAASILLDPSNRAHYLRRNWPDEWVQPAIDRAMTLWNDEYKTALATATREDLMEVDAPARPAMKQNMLGKHLQKLQVPRKSLTHGDDLLVFMEQENIDIGDLGPLEWWCLPEQQQRYPRLHRMAIDMFSIPPASAEPERTFSGARRTQSWDRLRMTAATLERLECIGNWLRNGHINLTQISSVLEELEEIEELSDAEGDEIEEVSDAEVAEDTADIDIDIHIDE